jgi:hypothetical protein
LIMVYIIFIHVYTSYSFMQSAITHITICCCRSLSQQSRLHSPPVPLHPQRPSHPPFGCPSSSSAQPPLLPRMSRSLTGVPFPHLRAA